MTPKQLPEFTLQQTCESTTNPLIAGAPVLAGFFARTDAVITLGLADVGV